MWEAEEEERFAPEALRGGGDGRRLNAANYQKQQRHHHRQDGLASSDLPHRVLSPSAVVTHCGGMVPLVTARGQRKTHEVLLCT